MTPATARTAPGHGPSGDQVVCHHCDNPPCVRANHLFLGTAAENTADMVAKQRQTRGTAINTARLNEEQVLSYLTNP